MRTSLLPLPLLLLAAACHSHDDGGALYEGCATDENRVTIDDYEGSGRIREDAGRGPLFTAPAPGAALPAAAPPTFAWQPSPADPGRASGNASCPQCPDCSFSAQHLPAVSGYTFDLRILKKAGGAPVYRVLTTKQRCTPPASLWQGLAGEELQVELIRVSLLRNDVVDGPYRAPRLTVRVQP
jgi:hypothetical protein